jgi:hypothetical protein
MLHNWFGQLAQIMRLTPLVRHLGPQAVERQFDHLLFIAHGRQQRPLTGGQQLDHRSQQLLEGRLGDARQPAGQQDAVGQDLAHDPELFLGAFRFEAIQTEDQPAIGLDRGGEQRPFELFGPSQQEPILLEQQRDAAAADLDAPVQAGVPLGATELLVVAPPAQLGDHIQAVTTVRQGDGLGGGRVVGAGGGGAGGIGAAFGSVGDLHHAVEVLHSLSPALMPTGQQARATGRTGVQLTAIMDPLLDGQMFGAPTQIVHGHPPGMSDSPCYQESGECAMFTQ